MAHASTSVRRGPRDVVSAGVVVFGPGRTVLLVHRPKYDDWSFPKGKLDRGERAAAAAVREVEEETGLRVRLGPPLGSQRYPVRGGMKTVLYWTGRPVDATDVSTYEPNAEIDDVRWVPVDEARTALTYPHDVDTLDEAVALRKRTRTLVVLRHAVARSRSNWSKDDRLRPLLVERQAAGRAARAGARGVRRRPTGHLGQHPLHADARAVRRRGRRAPGGRRPVQRGGRHPQGGAPGGGRARSTSSTSRRSAPAAVVLCTHRTVLPWVFDALGLEDAQLEKGEMLVVHLRRGRVVAVERHQGG